MFKKILGLSLIAIAMSGCVSMEDRQAAIWGPLAGAPNVEDAKVGKFHAPMKQVYQAVLDVLDDKNIPVEQRTDTFIKSGSHEVSIINEVESISFEESTGVTIVKWRTAVIVASSTFGSNAQNEERPLGKTPEAKAQIAGEWYAAIFKKLNH